MSFQSSHLKSSISVYHAKVDVMEDMAVLIKDAARLKKLATDLGDDPAFTAHRADLERESRELMSQLHQRLKAVEQPDVKVIHVLDDDAEESVVGKPLPGPVARTAAEPFTSTKEPYYNPTNHSIAASNPPQHQSVSPERLSPSLGADEEILSRNQRTNTPRKTRSSNSSEYRDLDADDTDSTPTRLTRGRPDKRRKNGRRVPYLSSQNYRDLATWREDHGVDKFDWNSICQQVASFQGKSPKLCYKVYWNHVTSKNRVSRTRKSRR